MAKYERIIRKSEGLRGLELTEELWDEMNGKDEGEIANMQTFHTYKTPNGEKIFLLENFGGETIGLFGDWLIMNPIKKFPFSICKDFEFKKKYLRVNCRPKEEKKE